MTRLSALVFFLISVVPGCGGPSGSGPEPIGSSPDYRVLVMVNGHDSSSESEVVAIEHLTAARLGANASKVAIRVLLNEGAVVGVKADESDANDFRARLKLNSTVEADLSNEITKYTSLEQLPVVVVLDKKGALVESFGNTPEKGSIEAELVVSFLLESLGTQTMRLYLFAAPWCRPCVDELKELNHLIPERLGTKANKLGIKVYVTSQANPNTAPTAESVAAFKAALGVSFSFAPDIPAGSTATKAPWTRYLAYIKDTSRRLPASVVVDLNDKAKKTFTPGKTVAEIMEYLESEILR